MIKTICKYCGKEFNTLPSEIKRGGGKYCSRECFHKDKTIDLTGQKFGRLTVIKKINNDEKYLTWLCKCDCGNEKIVRGDSLRGGITKSCGCLIKEAPNNRMRLDYGIASMRRMINNYKSNAKRRGIEYKLTEEQFKEITQRDCYYCGAKPNNAYHQKWQNGTYVYNGIDRIDNTKGYTIDNVVPCCKDCNAAKGKLTLQEFKDLIKRIYIKLYK